MQFIQSIVLEHVPTKGQLSEVLKIRLIKCIERLVQV